MTRLGWWVFLARKRPACWVQGHDLDGYTRCWNKNLCWRCWKEQP